MSSRWLQVTEQKQQEETIQDSNRTSKRETRDKIDIIADNLEICANTGPLKKTRIMQRANLNTNMTNGYLGDMLSKSLIKADDSANFAITSKGIITLHWYNRIVQLIGE